MISEEYRSLYRCSGIERTARTSQLERCARRVNALTPTSLGTAHVTLFSMNPSFFLSRPSWILTSVVMLALLGGLVARYSMAPKHVSRTPPSNEPAFQSVTMTGKGPFGGLGPEWTILRESTDAATIFAGASSTEFLLVKKIGEPILMKVMSIELSDASVARTELYRLAVRTIPVTLSTLFVIPSGDVSGAEALVRCGDTTCVMVELAHGPNEPFEPIPSEIPLSVSQFLVSADLR